MKLMTATAAIALGVTACGSNGEGEPTSAGDSSSLDFTTAPQGTVKTMGFNPSDEVGQSRADLAAEALTDVDVEMDTSDFDAQKFAALSAAGTLPDVVQMDRNLVATFAQKGLIMPLDDCFVAHDVVPDEYWYPAVVQEASWNGKVYAAPQFYQPSLIIVNKRVADAAGVALDDIDTSQPDRLLAAAQSMTALSGAQPTTLGFDPDMPGSIALWLEIFGGGVMDEEGKPTLDRAENIEALTYLTQLMDAQGGYAEVKSFKDTWDVFGDQNQYVGDKVGAATWAQWYINVLSNTKDTVELDAVPIRDLDGEAFAMAGGTAFAIPAAAKNPVGGCAWITRVTSLEAWEAAGDARAATVQEKNSIVTGLFTGSPAADQAVRDAHVVPSGIEGFDKMIETSYEILADTRTVGSSPVGQQINDALKNAAGVALSKEKSPEEALVEAQATALREWEALES
ncbi:ABC transporter substrate-binding protein [Tessaracoccus lapidicaptus]|uniref:ABC transporter substrate-binding protein n=1 Tax=Tessaracoccus lapidicaptus TaxID=1427523 RepID=UPI00333FE662